MSLMMPGPALGAPISVTLQSSRWLRTRTWLPGRNLWVLSWDEEVADFGHPSVHLFNEYLLSSYCVPSTSPCLLGALGAGDAWCTHNANDGCIMSEVGASWRTECYRH